MSFTQKLLSCLEAGLFQHIRAIIGANRDYPYHDYETATLTATYVKYSVGENNRNRQGTQSKLFVSKSTLVYSTVEADIKFNDTNNVEIDIQAGTWYTFKSNINMIFYKYASAEGTIEIHTEGTLPQENRSAE